MNETCLVEEHFKLYFSRFVLRELRQTRNREIPNCSRTNSTT